MSFSDCGFAVNQPPLRYFNFDAAARLVLLYEVGQDRLRIGFEGRALRSLSRIPDRAGMLDIMRSRPNLVLAGPLFRGAELVPDRLTPPQRPRATS